jgi:hypothetical protein
MSDNCKKCGGSGRIKIIRKDLLCGYIYEKCPGCNGTGVGPKVVNAKDMPHNPDIPPFEGEAKSEQAKCGKCGGRGEVWVVCNQEQIAESCPDCESKGEVEDEGVELVLDEGVMIDLMKRYEGNDDWNMFYFAVDELARKVKTAEQERILTLIPPKLDPRMHSNGQMLSHIETVNSYIDKFTKIVKGV